MPIEAGFYPERPSSAPLHLRPSVRPFGRYRHEHVRQPMRAVLDWILSRGRLRRMLRRTLDILGPFSAFRPGPAPETPTILERLWQRTSAADPYADWVDRYDRVTSSVRLRLRREVRSWREKPLISVLMPVYNTDPRWLRAAVGSIRQQIYPNWELCISDDASTRPEVAETLRALAAKDSRIKLTFRAERGHICANTNTAAKLALGDFIALVDADDELPEDALYWVARELLAHPYADMIFSDEDKIDARGIRFGPYFKSDWNPALMISQNAFCHLGVFRRSLFEQVGGLREGYEGEQDHDLTLRCAALTRSSHIRHIPRVLYHWRLLPESTSGGLAAKPYAWDAACRVMDDEVDRSRIAARVDTRLPDDPSRRPHPVLDYVAPKHWPPVTVVIPTALGRTEIRRCISAATAKTTYPNLEILLAVHDRDASAAEEFIAGLRDPRVRTVRHSLGSFNYSAANNLAAKSASGDYLCLLNDDVEPITADWLEQMVMRARIEGVGVVGAMLYYPDDTVQHAGIVLGAGGVADHIYRRHPRGTSGYFARALLDQDMSCVTAACMLVRVKAFGDVGGFDETLPVAFNDVDLCLRLRRQGWRVLWTPRAEMYHHESLSLGRHDAAERAEQFDRDRLAMRSRWHTELDNDPFYNPNLSLEHPYALAFPPRIPSRRSMV